MIGVVLSATTRSVGVARYAVPKLTFESWLSAASRPTQGAPIATVAREHPPVPLPASESEPFDVSRRSADGRPGRDVERVPDPVAPATSSPRRSSFKTPARTPRSMRKCSTSLPRYDLPVHHVVPLEGNWICAVPDVGLGKISCTNKCFAPGTSVVHDRQRRRGVRRERSVDRRRDRVERVGRLTRATTPRSRRTTSWIPEPAMTATSAPPTTSALRDSDSRRTSTSLPRRSFPPAGRRVSSPAPRGPARGLRPTFTSTRRRTRRTSPTNPTSEISSWIRRASPSSLPPRSSASGTVTVSSETTTAACWRSRSKDGRSSRTSSKPAGASSRAGTTARSIRHSAARSRAGWRGPERGLFPSTIVNRGGAQ